MPILYSIAGLLIIVIVHELGHIYAMIKSGIRIKTMGIGLRIHSLPHIHFRLNKKIPNLSLNLLLLGAYVEPSYGGKKKMERLPYTDMAFIHGAGVWVNTLFAMLIMVILQILAPEQMLTHKAVIAGLPIDLYLFLYVGILVILALCPRFFCSFIIPPLGIFVTYLTIKFIAEAPTMDLMGGPVSIVITSSPQMVTWVGAGKEIAFLSLVIVLLNMLPLPPLDSGQIIRDMLKRWVGERWSLAYGGLGMRCVLCLVALAVFGDIQKLIHLIL